VEGKNARVFDDLFEREAGLTYSCLWRESIMVQPGQSFSFRATNVKGQLVLLKKASRLRTPTLVASPESCNVNGWLLAS
jgi:hypothetical protein